MPSHRTGGARTRDRQRKRPAVPRRGPRAGGGQARPRRGRDRHSGAAPGAIGGGGTALRQHALGRRQSCLQTPGA
eukprot:11195346-Lingulodinium_polyedra.AAC.1